MKPNGRVARMRILRKRRRRIKAAIIAAVIILVAGIIFAVAMVVMAGKTEEKVKGVPIPEIKPIVQEMAVQEPEERQIGIPSMDWDAEESYMLAKLAMAEAESESTEGKAMVILTVLNRVWSDSFPGTIEEVIFEEHGGTYQFSPVHPEGRWWRVEPDEDCWKALNMVMVDHWDESEGALYFEATYNGENTWHSNNLEFIKTVGNHNFYK